MVWRWANVFWRINFSPNTNAVSCNGIFMFQGEVSVINFLCACPAQTPRLTLPAWEMSGQRNQLTDVDVNVSSQLSELWSISSLLNLCIFTLQGKTTVRFWDTAPPCQTPFSPWPWMSAVRSRASCRGWRTNIWCPFTTTCQMQWVFLVWCHCNKLLLPFYNSIYQLQHRQLNTVMRLDNNGQYLQSQGRWCLLSPWRNVQHHLLQLCSISIFHANHPHRRTLSITLGCRYFEMTESSPSSHRWNRGVDE